MTELTALPEEKYPEPERGPSRVLFKHTEHDGILASVYDQGDAYYEQETNTLDDVLLEIVEGEAFGWYVVLGFQMDYHRDYWGEVDGRASWDGLRRATWKDYEFLMWTEAPWFVRLMAKTNLKMPAWWPVP